MCAQVSGLGDELTSFVGRRRELTEIDRMLNQSRLVTLTGVGGVGKTRLALRAGESARTRYQDGVWLVELAKLTDPDLLAHTVAEALGVRDQSARSTEELLLDTVAEKHLLLIMDNCEHLLDACAHLIAELLNGSSHLVVLATSRERLGVFGEQSWPVPPLSMPDLANVAPSRGGYVYGHEALELFEERARKVVPGYVIDKESRPEVARLCQGLDGLPLAIELAAVQLRSMSIEQILERLQDRYRVLTAGNRGGPARHQTLRAAVDWSFGLCSREEQALWARMSVFSGSFDLDAAEEICALGEINKNDVLELLSSLIDKSVVLCEEKRPKVRYWMLETIREYGRERLVANGSEACFQKRHRDYYLQLSEWSENRWFGPDQLVVWDRLQHEQPNLWAALEFSLSVPSETPYAAQMAGSLCFYWNACGHLRDGRFWLDRALAADKRPTASRVKALWVNGYVAMTQGDNEAAMKYFDEADTLADRRGDQYAKAMVAQFRGSAEQFKGNLFEAESLLRESVCFHREAGIVNSLTVLGVAQLGFVCCLTGQAENAIELSEACRITSEEHGEQWAYSWALWVAGLAWWTLREHGKSADALRASLDFKNSLNDRLGISACVELLAWVAVEEGNAEHAAELFGTSRTSWATVGAPLFGSKMLVDTRNRYLSWIRKELGDTVFENREKRGEQLSTSDAVMLAQSGPKEEFVSGALAGQLRLTRREREVARLIAAGLTNKDIASQLVISQRTVEGHVENVLYKLGVKSRTQVAIWFANHVGGENVS